MSALDEVLRKGAEDLLYRYVGETGMQIDPVEVVKVVEKVASYVADVASAHSYRAVLARANAEAAKVTTLEEAEAAARSRR